MMIFRMKITKKLFPGGRRAHGVSPSKTNDNFHDEKWPHNLQSDGWLEFDSNNQNLEKQKKVRDSGPAMTWSIHAILWLQLREHDLAEKFFNSSYQPHVTKPFGIWTENRWAFNLTLYQEIYCNLS